MMVSAGSLGMMQGIIAFGSPGQAVSGLGVAPQFDCTDVYGNEGGDWAGPLEGQLGVDGNICQNPLFCNPAAGDYTLAEDSPCLDMTECIFSVGSQRGCYGVGCAESGAPEEDPLHARFRLSQNRPNPFSPSTAISYTLPASGRTRLRIFDLSGRLVATLVDDVRSAGEHEVRWDGRNGGGGDVAAGVYFARLEFAGQTEVSKLVVVR